MPEEAPDTTRNRARGLDRAFAILEHFRQKRTPLRPNEIATGIGAPRSSVYELVNVMLDSGVLEYADGDGRVYLGRKLYFLGLAYADQFDLGREAEAVLQNLAEETRETAQLCLLDGHKYTVAMMKEGMRPFRISSDLGEAVPIPWTASGRLLLSHLSNEEILAFIPKEDFQLPDGTWLDPDIFLAQAHRAREEGYFTFDSIADTYTHCFAAPVYQPDGICVATLCLVAPRGDAKASRASYIKALTDAADLLSLRIGGDTTGREVKTG
ncbi:MAG TPA: IclR family transcriptional regulator [Devosiaceae bacterium]|nr:IclR family transcriptional regulator [Devosiaceae bacterium]